MKSIAREYVPIEDMSATEEQAYHDECEKLANSFVIRNVLAKVFNQAVYEAAKTTVTLEDLAIRRGVMLAIEKIEKELKATKTTLFIDGVPQK